MECPKCTAIVDDGGIKCGACGYDFITGDPKKKVKRPSTSPQAPLPSAYQPVVRKNSTKKPSVRPKKATPDQGELFLLQDGKLIPITMTMKVSPRVVGEQGKALVSIWNRMKRFVK